MYLTNVVCSGNVCCSIDLREMCYRLVNTRYHPTLFPGLIWQHRTIGGNCLLFSNGKIQCQGKATSLREGLIRLRRYARVLQTLGLPVRLTEAKVMTASAFHILSTSLDLESFVKERQLVYEPELFPTATFRVEGVTFSCFRNGKIVITGIRTLSDINRIVNPTLVELELYTIQT
ncbi:MAG: hypothetical protein ABW072_02025 [Sedimenticola sp.]